MKELISIIIPVYKVEPYLKRCVNSVLQQTYQEIEVILVDDGSPDNCGNICDEYAKQDNRVRVIHKSNGGLSDARNAGIDMARGQYISFLDSDDWINMRYIELLYQMILQTHSDIAVCNFVRTSNEHINTASPDSVIIEFSNIEALNEIMGKHGVAMIVAWCKLYRKHLFNGIRYPCGKIHEDEFTTYKLIYAANKVVFTTEPLLYYWQREDSIMAMGYNITNRSQAAQAVVERAEFYNEKGLNSLRDNTYKMAFYIYKGLMDYIAEKRELDTQNAIIREFKDLKIKLRKGKHSLKFKIGYEIYYLAPWAMRGVYKFYADAMKKKRILNEDSEIV